MGCRAWCVYDRHAEARRLLTLPRWPGGPDRAGDRIAESIRIQIDFTHRDFSLRSSARADEAREHDAHGPSVDRRLNRCLMIVQYHPNQRRVW